MTGLSPYKTVAIFEFDMMHAAALQHKKAKNKRE